MKTTLCASVRPFANTTFQICRCLSRRFRSARGLAQSKTLRACPCPGRRRAVNWARLLVAFILMLCATAGAQTTFSGTDLPQHLGEFSRAYYSTNVNVAALLGQPGGPQRWDFSSPQQAGEVVWRTDIVSPDDPNPGAFPGAAYAERDTQEPTTQIAWRYYSMTNQGRLYYGFDNPINDPASPLVVFDQPTLDLPCPVQYGQSWNRYVSWYDTVLSFPVVYDFTASVEVDAYGAVVLPGLGERPALRVRELHDYEASYYFLGTWVPFVSQTNVYYYWLTPQVGVSAQVILFGLNTLSPTPLDQTNLFLRLFERSGVTNSASWSPVNDLRIRIEGAQAMLDWGRVTNASAYRVEALGTLATTNWQSLASPTTNWWSEPLTGTQRFYRVFWNP
jgi:hypothetical protein